MKELESIRSRIWSEEPETENPYVAGVCRCAGYDVFGEILVKARWSEYLYLMFTGERPTGYQADALERIAIALSNPGLRDHSVRAAMNAGVGGSTSASSLMAAIAVGSGQNGGAHEVCLASELWEECGTSLDGWKQRLDDPPSKWKEDFWPEVEHIPGFDPYATSCCRPVIQTLEAVAFLDTPNTTWLKGHREELESAAGLPLAMTGLVAAVLGDLGFSPEHSEMLFLLLRLPGAAVHALEQRGYGWRRYPFFKDGLVLANDPENRDGNSQ